MAFQLALLAPVPARRQLPSFDELPSLAGRRGSLSVDTEAYESDLIRDGPGIYRGKAKLIGFSLAIDDHAWYVPFAHRAGGNYDERNALDYARQNLNLFQGEVIFANPTYDLGNFSSIGVAFDAASKIHDIQLMSTLVNEHRLSNRLGDLLSEYLGVAKEEDHLRQWGLAHGFKSEGEIKSHIAETSGLDAYDYACGDVRHLETLYVKLRDELIREEQLEVYEEIERPLILVIQAMQRRGAIVNLRRAEEVQRILQRAYDRLADRVRYLAGPRADVMKAASLGPALEARGIVPGRTPKSGAYKIDKAFFERHRGDALIDAVAAAKRTYVLINTFLRSYILDRSVPERGRPDYGRVFYQLHQLKSEDGGTIARLSSSHPNMQNLPSRQSDFDDLIGLNEPVVRLVRGIFEPEDGETWQRDDLSQIEFRYLTHFARGPGAAEARRSYNDDPTTDFHKLTAQMLGVDPEDKVRRKRIKNTNFCCLYGGGVDKLALTFGCSTAEAQRFYDEYNRRLPFIKVTFNEASRVATARGFVQTVSGRRQRFPFWEPLRGRGRALPRDRAIAEYGPVIRRAWGHKALNRVLQGSAADHIKKALVAFWRAGLQDVLGAPLLTVHDENNYSVPRTAGGEEAAAEARRLMETAITIRVPVVAETERGANWGVTS